MQALHPGVVMLNGNASSYINLQQASGPQSCGLIVPIIGTAGSGTGSSQGLSFEMVFKYPAAYPLYQSSKVFDLGQGGTETIDVAAQTSGSLQLELQNNVQPGLELNSQQGYAATYSAQGGFTTGVWNHVVWVLSSPNFSNYSAQWSLYINGSLVPFIGSAFYSLYPLPVYRPLSFIGGSDYSNANLPLTLDAFRIYDYALQANTIANIYNTLYNPSIARGQSGAASTAVATAATGGSATTTGTTAASAAAFVTSSPAVTPITSSSSSSSLSGGAIAGIVIGSIAGVLVILLLLVCLLGSRRTNKSSKLDDRTHDEGYDSQVGTSTAAEVEMGEHHTNE